ncbi:DUF4407 domain-containing protein [Nonomuraea sp. B10E15]|uniref:DUF4407 domain-containing protein n=1 Tax=Nonomuraea sp. B10E15 TaxID=3153560 RepID=UPI00325F04BB
MGGLLLYLSGARRDILSMCPSEAGKFRWLGGAVLVTSSVAALSMSLALGTALDVNLALAVITGLVWGLAIMSLDRWLIATLGDHGAGRLWLALPRLLLSLMLGVILSTPLVLHIFRPEIDAQIVQMQQARAEAFQRQQSAGESAREITRLTQLVDQLHQVIESKGQVTIDPAKDPKTASLTTDRDRALEQANAYYDDWQCQLYGGECESVPGAKGDGPRARELESRYRSARHEVDQLNTQIDQRRQELTRKSKSAAAARYEQARADLPGYQAQLDRLRGEQEDRHAAFESQSREGGGLLLRIEALGAASAKNATLNTANLLIFLLLALIECLPVMAKLMHRPGTYERIEQAQARREEQAAARAWLMSAEIDAAQGAGKLTLEQVWERESRQPDRPSKPSDPVAGRRRRPADEDELQDRALRGMRDARAPEDPDATPLPRGQRP